MVRKLVLAAAAFVCLYLATACDSFSTEPGSFVVVFQWETGHEPDTAAKEYYMWAYYQEWKGGEGKTFPADIESNAKSLDEAGPVKLGSGDNLNFTKLTYGDNRFVRAAIWDNEERSGDPLYVGVSELFNFSASDRNKAVAVNMKLQANAGVDENGTGGSFAIEVRQGGAVVARVGEPTVTLRLTVKNADTIILANDLNFEKGIIEKKLTELTKIDETTYELADWNITEGWTDLGDALYSVFGKSKNTLGYESAPKRADIYLDTTAPVPNVTPFPTVAKLSDTIEVRFSFDEEVDPAALSIAWGGLAFTLADNKANKSYTYTYTVTDTDDEKEYTFSLTASDGVGNATEAFELGKVTIDRTLPSISGITVAGTDGKETLRSGDVLTVSFTASEELSADPVVKIDDKTLTLGTKTGLDYTYTYTLGAGDITGIKTITASLRDLAKNDATVSIGQTIFDNILPLLMGVETTPARAKKGIPIEAVLSFSEPVDPAKVMLIAVFDDDPTKEIAFTLTGPSIDDQSFSFSHTVDDIDLEGNYTIRVEATDTAGNEIAEDQKEVGDTVIDKTAPTVSGLTIGGIDPLIPVKAGTAFTVSFTVSEEIKPESLLEIGKLQVRLDAADCVASGLDYTCSHTVDAAEGDGTKHVAVAAVDLAGNLTREPYADPVIYDTADPVLINAFVNPADRVGLGQKLVVLFSLSETPSSYDFDGDGLDFTGEVTPDGLSHTYTHIVADTDEERTYNFTASVTDLAGNTLDPVAIGSVFVDITPPDVASHDLSATNVKLGAQFTLSFTVTEELKTTPTVLIGAKNISGECTVDGLDYTCTHAAAADEGDGVKQIALQLTDLAGNTTSRTLKDETDQYVTIEYDVTAPEVVNPVIAPEKANLGAVIDVRFSFTEDVEEVVIDWGSLADEFTRFNEDTNKRLFIYKHTVDADDDEGTFPVSVTAATDMAGNPIAGIIAIGSVEIDNSAPTLSAPDVAVNGDTDKTLAKEGDTVTVTFTVAETIAEHTVRIGLIEVADCTFDSGLQSYTCAHTVASGDGEGSKDITVELKDEAGNADTYAIGQVSFDMTAAELANTIILPTKSNNATPQVEVKFSFTEEIVMTALSDGGLGLSGANCPLNGAPRRDFVCDYTFAGGDTQVHDYPVTVSATDRAGNAATGLTVGTVSVDRDIPTLTAQDVAPQTLKLGEEFIISFTASETLVGDPIVKVGALQLGAYTQKIGNAYEYRHTAAPEEGDGSKLITVSIQDPAGNSATVDLTKTVTYDTTSPAPLNPTVSPETANRQTAAIDVRFSFPEDVEAITLVGNKSSGDAGAPATLSFVCASQGNAKTYKCTASLGGVTWDIAGYALWVNGRDLAGNYIDPADETNGQALGLSAVIDRKLPTISNEAVTQCTVADCDTTKTISKAGDVVRASFSVSETPREAPVVTIGGRAAAPCAGPGDYGYCLTVGDGDGDGQKTITVDLYDAAGNHTVHSFTQTVAFDVNPPTILNPVVTPQKANGTSTITATFSFSEEILPGAMSVASAGGLPFACSTTDNKTYSCTRSVTVADGAGYAIVVSATDAAGNSATGLAVGSIEIDRINPLVGTVTLRLWDAPMVNEKLVAKTDDNVELYFSVTKTLKNDPVVQIAGQAMTKSAQNGLNYTYLYTVQAADGDGLKSIRVELTDEYDNQSSTTLTETAAFDVTAPAVLNPVISPEKANATSVITASFSFSEEIDPLKMTVLSAGGLVFTCVSIDQKTYTCTRTVQIADGAGYTIRVSAEDAAGNLLTDETIGSIAIDRVDPAVVNPLVFLFDSTLTTQKSVVKTLDKVRVTFTASDTLKNDPLVQIAGQAMTKTAQAGLNYTYQYTVQATDGDGQKQIRIELTDEYDNHSSTTLASTAPFDVTAPAALNPVIVPLKANASSLIRVAFSFSESILPATVTVRSNDGQNLAYGCSTSDNKQYLCTRSVVIADGAGYGILVSATDAAGNTLTDSLLGTFAIDRVLPTANNPVLTLWNSDMTVNKTVVKALDKVQVTFTASETLKEDPKVQVGGQLMTKTGQSGLDYTYQYTVQSADGDGQKTVRIELTDQSDNTRATTLGSTAPFDVTAPAVLNPIVNPENANASSNIIVRFSFSEEIPLANMSVASAGGLSYTCATSDNKQYVCGRAVQLADNNGYDIVVDATDTAGNTLTDQIIGAVSIDRIAPTADPTNATFWNPDLSAQKSSITTGDKVVLTFTASEPLGSDPVVTVGGQLMTQTAKAGLNYAYRYTVQATDGDGQKQIRIYLVDEHDNSTNTIIVQTAPFDVTAPSVLNPTVSPAYAKQGATVTASFSFTEPIMIGNVTLSGNGTLAFTCVSGDNVVYSCTHTVLVGDPQQAYTLTVAATDGAGNTLAATTLGTFTVDRTLPALTGQNLYLLAADGVTPKTPLKALDKVRYEFDVNDTLGRAPVVRIGGSLMTTTGCTGTRAYAYCYTVAASDGDGSKTITIELEDRAANVNTVTAASTAPFDVTAPAVLNPIIAPAKANASSTITASFSFSETILPAAMSVASAGGLAYSCSTSDNKKYDCTRVVAVADGAGYTIVVNATDAAGNSISGTSLGTVAIDRVLPLLSGAPAPVIGLYLSDGTTLKPSQGTAKVRATEIVKISFTTVDTQMPGVDPVVRIGGKSMTKASQAGNAYVYSYTVLAGDGDGVKPIIVDLQDEYGNTNTLTPGTAPFDVTAPVVLNPVITPTKANATSTIIASFSFGETILPAAMSVASAGGLAFTCSTSDNKKYDCTRLVAVADGAGYTIVVNATDAAGNSISGTSLGTVAIDRVLPLLSGAPAPVIGLYLSDGTTLKPSQGTAKVRATEIVKISFTTVDTQMPGVDPVVRIGGKSMTKASQAGNAYVYSYTVLAGDGDGVKPIIVDLQDEYGNTNTLTPGTAPFDVTAPAVLNPAVTPVWAKQGAVVTASFSFTEPITVANVTISGNGALAFVCASGDNVVYSCTHTVAVTDTQQAYTLQVSATDTAGNTLAATTLGTFTVDRTLPAITGQNLYLLAADGVTPKTPLKVNDKVRYEFDVNDTLGRTPVVRIGGSTMTATGCVGTRTYAYCYTVLGSDGDGNKTITIELEDRAANQNTVTASSSAPFDVTTPVLISPVVTPTYAMVGAVVRATFNYSETVASMTFNWNTLTNGSSCTTSDNKSYTCTHTVLAGDTQATYNFTAMATDAAGNTTGYLAIGSTTVDRTAATIGISSITVTANSGVQYPDGRYAVANGHIVSADVTITTSETLAADPVLDLGGFAMTQITCTVPATNKFCYQHTVSDTEGEGNKFVSLTAEDRAGNITVKTQLQAVVFDFSGPRLVSDLFDRIPSFSSARDAIGKIQYYSIRDPLTNEFVAVLLTLYADETVVDGTVTLNGISLGSPTVNSDQVTYYKVLSDANAAGTYTLSVTWSDRLGNAATRNLSWKMAIDKTPTNAADIDMEMVRFIRIPYGSEDTAGLPRYKLVGDAGARLDSNIVIVTAYTASGSFAGQTTVNADNSFLMANMSSGNVETVYLNPISRTGASMMPAAGFDPASDLLTVENTRYIATMGYKVAGSDLANPHEWQSARNTAVSLVPAGMNTSVPANGTLLARRDASLQESGTISKWIQLPTDVHPNASWRTMMCYDAARDRLVLFGGLYMYLYNETWEWYDGKWNAAVVDDPEGDGEPIKLQAGQMAYDNRRGVCVYYGGSDAYGTIMDKTWEWNGRSWKRIYPADPEGDGDPVGISYGGMAYDIHRGVMVLAGGASGGSNWLVYEYNGESWREMPRMSGDSPGGPGVNVSYDRDRRVMVAAGGSNLGDETVEYSGQKWRTVCGGTTGCTGAPTRDYPMMAYDAKRKVTVHFGGRVGTTPYNELREWNGTSWTLKSPTGDIPAARCMGSMAYHEGRQTVILYGGIGSGANYYFDTWEWDGTKWTRLSATNLATPHPTAKSHYAIAYDPSRKVAILHGGKFSSAVVSGETWEWNGYAWKKLTPATTVYRYGHSLVFNTTDNTLLMFGGKDDAEAYRNEIYQWDGTNWAVRTLASGSAPTGRAHHSAVFDSARSRMMVFGGQTGSSTYAQQTYEWDNTARTWSYRYLGGPEARIYAGMTYDPVRQRSMLFGGMTYGTAYTTGFGDTWEYDGAATTWTRVVTNPWVWGDFPSCPFSETDCWDNSTATQSPMPRWGHLMVYDPVMRRTILSGGMIFEDWSEGLYLEQSDTWVYNSATTSWSELNVANGPAFGDKSLIYFHKGYYDTTKGEVASWGGVEGMEDAQLQYSKTNVLRTGASELPSQLFTVSLDAAGLAEGYAWRDIQSISLSVYAGATVYGTTCAATNGVTLYGWANDRWLLLDQSPAARTAVTELKFSVNKPEIIQKLLNGEASELYFKIEAKDKAGCGSNGDPLIAVDYAELTVDIREDTIADRYYLSTSQETWANARTACAARGMDLAVINSQKESDLIESAISTGRYYWIGLSEPTTEGTWNWVNGLPAWTGTYTGYGATWTDWAIDTSKAMVKPSDTSVLNCGLLYYYLDNWIWWDWGCGNATYYICEKRDYGYTGITGTKDANEDACKTNDGHLVSVNSELEEDAIWPFVTTATVNQWIGLTNMSATDNIHTWQDGEISYDGNTTAGIAYGFTHWNASQPNSAADDCVDYYASTHDWYDTSCATATYGGICEY